MAAINSYQETLTLANSDLVVVSDVNGTTKQAKVETLVSFTNNNIVKVADNFADDSAAATGGIAVGGLYHTNGTVKIRLA
jgi:hypothetical protein